MIPVASDDCAAWLHPAAGPAARDRGVVLVPALGFEELCTRRTLRILADRLAAAGLPTLRFDLHGTADSLGDDTAPDRLARWTADINRAVDRLRGLTGVTEVVLIGLRFGALVAAHAAAGRDDIAMLGLLAPPASGKAYARETAALARIIAAQPANGAGGITVAGFHVTEATVQALKGLGWPAAPCRRLLVAAPGQAAAGKGAKGLADRFVAPDVTLQRLAFTGYERMICDPTASEAPFAVIDEVVAWAGDGASAALAPVSAPAPGLLKADAFTEEAVTFGPDNRLAGILCRPVRQAAHTIILTNSGGTPHIGWARMTVTFARALAAEGIASLRLDFQGLGDSRAETDEPTPFYYDTATPADIIAAVDLLAARGLSDVTVSGNCSGAHHAFHAALADRRIRGLVLTNLQCFIWGPRYKLPLGAWMAALPVSIDLKKRQEDEELSEAARQVARWKERTVALARRYAKPAVQALQQLAGRLSRHEATGDAENPVAAGFDELSRRGTRILLAYSEGDPGLDELALYMGPDGIEATRLAGVAKRIIAGADHPMTQSHARTALLALMIGFLAGRDEARAA
ncbi:serine aminopeptidase domain-containing protein [Phreatobacter stygius]|nr:alpha/beta hydrolase [Phreatobacter stygius]